MACTGACKSMMTRRISSANRAWLSGACQWAETQPGNGGRWIRPYRLVWRIQDAFARQCTLFRFLQGRRDRVSDGEVLVVQVGDTEDGEELRAVNWAANWQVAGSCARYGVTTAMRTHDHGERAIDAQGAWLVKRAVEVVATAVYVFISRVRAFLWRIPVKKNSQWRL